MNQAITEVRFSVFPPGRVLGSIGEARLRGERGTGFEGIEIDSWPGNPHGIKRGAHGVVTAELVDEAEHPMRVALDRVVAFFRKRRQ